MDNKFKHLKILEKKYGFTFPLDVLGFQNFIEELSQDLIDVLEIDLAGPLQVNSNEIQNPIMEYRHYNDPPEFFTMFNGNIDGLHWGYYLDDPNNLNFIVVKYYSNDAYELMDCGNNLFEAMKEHIKLGVETCKEYLDDDPEESEFYSNQIEKLGVVRTLVQKYLKKYKVINNRQVTAKTRDGLGIVVPNSLYKPISKKDKFQVWNYEPTRSEVDNMLDKAQKLFKEGYPGAIFKLGKDLWCYPEYFSLSYELLDSSYKVLNRELFRKTLKIAIDYRILCNRNSS
jgi:hypothetical protein